MNGRISQSNCRLGKILPKPVFLAEIALPRAAKSRQYSELILSGAIPVKEISGCLLAGFWLTAAGFQRETIVVTAMKQPSECHQTTTKEYSDKFSPKEKSFPVTIQAGKFIFKRRYF
jgi:hypothetical protein